jgi:hypothetical protein
VADETSTLELPRDGTYQIHHVHFGVGYSGWYLITTVTPGDRVDYVEFAFLPLDLEASGLPGITPEFDRRNVQHGIWPLALDSEIGHRLTGLHHRIEAWGRGRGIPDQRRPQYVEIPRDRLRRHVLETVVMPDDDPFRKVWRSGLHGLEAWTRCPALRDALRSAGLKARVSVERG